MYELFIAIRHLTSRRRQTIFSVLAVGLAVMLLMWSQAMMVGFTDEMYSKTVDRMAHVTVEPQEDEDYIHLYRKLTGDIRGIDGVVAMLLKDMGEVVEDDYSNITRLFEIGIIPADIADRLKKCNGLRNYLVHRYHHVDDAIAMDSRSEVRDVFYKENIIKEECVIAKKFEGTLPSILGFGCSDCKCKSHLFYGTYNEIKQVIDRLNMKSYSCDANY